MPAVNWYEDPNDEDILVDVFKDGVLLKDWTLDEIRKKAEVP